ncbi:MAG: hypothetical protein VB108_01850 [Anaerolineaceae bacterium]|nr:hypothetical protein [Anaerolineaceae bacterium]
MRKVSKWIALIVYIITLTINFLGAAGKIGYSQKEVSDSLPNLFVPGPRTFAIWGLIYLMTFVFLAYQFFAKSQQDKDFIEEKINFPFVLMCLLNMGWIIVFSQRLIPLSTILIIGFLLVVYWIMDIIMVWKPNTLARKLAVKFPFGLYAGWLAVAVVANITATLVDIKWNRFGLAEDLWLYIILAVVIILLSLLSFKYRCPAIPAVGIWAYWGILQQHQTVHNSAYPVAIWILYAGMAVFAVDLVYLVLKTFGKEKA